jgi:hypothetical protein
MSSAQKIIQAAAGNVDTGVEPVGIDFDGTNDSLSRSSDLTGNADGKTFTFSAWVYRGEDATGTIYSSGGLFRVFFSNDYFSFKSYNSSISVILNAQANFVSPRNTWQQLFWFRSDLAND